MRLFKRDHPGTDLELELLEKRLRSSLREVAPRPIFVSSLGARLMAGEFQVPSQSTQKVSSVLLVVGGIIGSVVMVVASIRGLLSLIKKVEALIQNANKNPQKQQISPV
jgi:hypothetical protein